MQPITIITGSLLAQVLLGIVMFGASIILHVHGNRPSHRYDYRGPGSSGLILFLLLASIAILVSTKSLSAIWLNLFKGTAFVGIDDQTAIFLVFVIDIFVTSLIVGLTGGAFSSPFQPIFFLIPTLALLLYESTQRVLLYSVLVTGLFVALSGLRGYMSPSDELGSRRAYVFVSLSSLAVAVIVGLLTRSCPAGTC